MWYNNEAVTIEGQRNWSLKIEQQEIEEVQSEKKYSAKEISLEILKRILLKQKVKEARKKLERLEHFLGSDFNTIDREFDPGSGWTLAACITHSSRTELLEGSLRMEWR